MRFVAFTGPSASVEAKSLRKTWAKCNDIIIICELVENDRTCSFDFFFVAHHNVQLIKIVNFFCIFSSFTLVRLFEMKSSEHSRRSTK